MPVRVSAAFVALLVVFSLEARKTDADAGAGEGKKATTTNEAIARGVAWLKSVQEKDGSFDYLNLHPKLSAFPMSQGSTALAALALLKSGVPAKDPVVDKAVQLVLSKPIEHVYSAGLVLLVLDALAHPELSGEGSTAAKPAKLGQRELDLGRAAVEFLEKNQQAHIWRYPSHRDGEDSSNAQYALLGLDAAERLGLKVSTACYEKAQAFYVENQEKEGPEVEAFPVPGADMSIAELKSIEKETRERIAKIKRAFSGKKPGETDASGHLEDDLVRLAEQDAAKKVFPTGERRALPKMRARGFPYATHTWNGDEPRIYGSMTASGVACLFVCKAHLEGTPAWKPIKESVDRAIRDGMAWLAKNFQTDGNPKHNWHQDYWLYSLERASILTITPKVGSHDWYREGCLAFIEQQKDDGSFDAGAHTTSGPMVDTCFALLFMARGTTPIVKLPERVVTGEPGR